MRPLKITIVYALFLLLLGCDMHSKQDEAAEAQQVMQLIEESSLDKNLLVIKGISDSEIDYSIYDGWLVGWAENDASYYQSLAVPGDERCRGNGKSFARCVQLNLEQGTFLKLYEDGGDYVAEESS